MKRVLIFLVLMLFASAWAQDNPVQVSIKAFIVTADGTLTESTTAERGDLIEYQITAVNQDDTTLPSESVSVTGPVPESSTYVSGSATKDVDITLGYSEDGNIFDTVETDQARAVRWTLNYPLEPDQEVNFTYRVTINGETSGSNSPPSGTGSTEAFTQAMFGHLGVIEIDCPAGFDDPTEATGVTCGEAETSFSLFRQGWDLYADYESEVPVVPTATSAWRSSGGLYTREYNLNGSPYVVSFNEIADGQGLVVIVSR